MSIINSSSYSVVNEAEEYVSDAATSAIFAAYIAESCSPAEIEQIILEQANDTLQILEERSIVKLDKKAKKNHARKMAIYELAKEDGNKWYKKLVTLWKLEALINKKLDKIYGKKADARVRSTARKSANSKSSIIQHVSKGLTVGNPGKKGFTPKPVIKSKPVTLNMANRI